jgi:hypothetical protein
MTEPIRLNRPIPATGPARPTVHPTLPNTGMFGGWGPRVL